MTSRAQAQEQGELQPNVWRSFARGLFSPSPTALAVTMGTTATLFAALLVFVDGVAVAKASDYMAFGPHDDGLEATAESIMLSGTARGAPILVFGGASSTRESLIPTDEMARQLRLSTNREVSVFDVTMGGETAWEMTALVDGLGAGDRGMVVLGVNPFLFVYAPEELADLLENPRIGLTSDRLDAEARRLGFSVPIRTGIYVVDNRRFLLSRLQFLRRSLVDGPPVRQRYRFDGEEPVGDDEWRVVSESLDTRLQRVDDNRDYHMGFLAEFIERKRDEGVRVILLETPMNPRLVRIMGEERYHAHTDRMAAFAAVHGALYWQLNEAVGLDEDDYYDYGHLGRPDARARYSAVLMERLAPLIEEL